MLEKIGPTLTSNGSGLVFRPTRITNTVDLESEISGTLQLLIVNIASDARTVFGLRSIIQMRSKTESLALEPDLENLWSSGELAQTVNWAVGSHLLKWACNESLACTKPAVSLCNALNLLHALRLSVPNSGEYPGWSV